METANKDLANTNLTSNSVYVLTGNGDGTLSRLFFIT
ncbi:hypothetical protein MHYMCMPSP_01123 [Hyalomma marginatum]|uniref:Uncharacterized protein n=1 Tax=Hyalomma marginatum TaxID=34627 RepID=A0A8S4C4E4_9ACAR|nr:hypothetical protein MHYMCMPSP_01123 [Hyalomma marginatum]CAG7600203.1 hypothetical protein MHYMCMPASI_01160 [Hyalomma marginatum]